MVNCTTLGQTSTSYASYMSNVPPNVGGCEINVISKIPGPAKYKTVTFMMTPPPP